MCYIFFAAAVVVIHSNNTEYTYINLYMYSYYKPSTRDIKSLHATDTISKKFQQTHAYVIGLCASATSLLTLSFSLSLPFARISYKCQTKCISAYCQLQRIQSIVHFTMLSSHYTRTHTEPVTFFNTQFKYIFFMFVCTDVQRKKAISTVSKRHRFCFVFKFIHFSFFRSLFKSYGL